MKEIKTRGKKLTLVCILYRKAYIIPKHWVTECLKVFKISLLVDFITKTMQTGIV